MTDDGLRPCAFPGCEVMFKPKRATQKYHDIAEGRVVSNRKMTRAATIPEQAGGMDEADAIALLERNGYRVDIKPRPPEKVVDIDLSKMRGKRLKIGVISDTHLSSRYQQRTFLLQDLEYMRREGVAAILVGGDVTDGPPGMHAGHQHNIFNHLYTSQRDYALETLPEIGVPWYFISGNHDDSWIKSDGGEIVKDICAQRDDFTYVGRSHGFLSLNDLLIQLEHPHVGGVTKTLSLPLQNIINQAESERKPHILFAGNWHKRVSIEVRNVLGFMLPSYQAQTPFMASKNLVSVIGGLILEFGRVPKGLAPETVERWLLHRAPIPSDY